MSKKYTTNFLEDTNGSTGSANQVLVSTAAGIDWVDGSGSGIIGGPYLPLSAGSSYPLTGDLYINDDVPSIILNDTNASSPTNTAAYISFRSQGTQQGYIGYGSGSTNDIALYGASGSDAVIYSGAGLALTLDTSQNATFTGDVTVSGGDITLGGATGRIQGIDTISSGTDAVNRNYVDTEIGNIPSGLAFEGNWNASTDTPTLSGTTQDNGKFWIVSVAGSTNLSGITDWQIGDWAIYVDNGAGTDAWQKVDNSSTLSGLGAAGKVAFWSTTANVSYNNNFSYDGTYLTSPRIRVGDGTDGYFYSDSAGRTAFTGGDFYIQSVSNAYNYATNNYHGNTSGDNQLFRGNPLSGNSWNITGAGAGTFTQVSSPIFSGNVTTSGDGQSNYPFRLGTDYNSYMVAASGNTWGLFWAGGSGARYGTNGNGGPGNIWGNSTNPNEFAFVGGDSTAWTVYGTNGNVWQKGDLWVNGGDIVLGGTGRIQGVDTVSASTDAANKAYVDARANDDITALAFSGTTTQTLTATQRDSSTLTASFNITKTQAGGTGPSLENLNTVANNVTVGQMEYRGFNGSSTNAPPTSDNANGVISIGQHSGNYGAQLAFSSNGNMYWRDNPSTSFGSWRTMWDSGNDGAGSGLDADLLDGQQPTQNGGANKIAQYASNGYLYNNNWIHPANSTGLFYDAGVHFHETGNYMYSSTSLQASNDMRAPIFYDRNDTGYYVNPASTSNLNGLTVNGTITGNISGNAATATYATAAGSTDQIDGIGFRNTNSNSGINADSLNSNGITYYTSGVGTLPGFGASDGTLYSGMYSSSWQHQIAGDFRTGRIGIRGKNNGTWQAWRTVIDNGGDHQTTGGILQSNASLRAPIFYDSNDTGYYVNPASTSRMSEIDVNNVDIVASAAHGLRFWSGSNSYSIRMSSSTDGTYGGRVGGETTSDYNMYFTMAGGTNRGFVFNNGLNNAIAGIDASGNGRFEGDVIAYSASDKRLKDNIKPIENATDKINKIGGYTFDWNSNQETYKSGTKDIGVIAQEVEEVLPEVVTTRDNGYKAVKYEKLVALLIQSNKELTERIEQLETLINK